MCLVNLSVFLHCRQHIQVFEEKMESCPGNDNSLLTKHMDSSDDNVDKACLSDSRAIPVSGEVNLRPIGDGEWSDIQTTEARIADVREIAAETEGSSLDITVVSQPVSSHHEQDVSSSQP